MEDIIKEIHSKAKKLEELQGRKRSILTIKNEKAMNITKQLSLKEKVLSSLNLYNHKSYKMRLLNIFIILKIEQIFQYEKEIQKMRSLIEDNETRKLELQEKMITIEEKRQKVIEDYNTHKLEAQRVHIMYIYYCLYH